MIFVHLTAKISPVYTMSQTTKPHSPLRLTLLILSLLGLILTSIFLSRRSIHAVQEASASIYKDRLVPSAIIAQLSARVYQKRLLLETYVLGSTRTNRSQLVGTLSRLNRQVDSLLTEYGRTKLTASEADQFGLLKQRLTAYNQLERELTTNLSDLPKARQTLFTGTGNTTFSEVTQTLAELSTIQLTVGEELVGQSRGETNYIYVLTALQIGLVLFVGLSLFWHRF